MSGEGSGAGLTVMQTKCRTRRKRRKLSQEVQKNKNSLNYLKTFYPCGGFDPKYLHLLQKKNQEYTHTHIYILEPELFLVFLLFFLLFLLLIVCLITYL